MIGRLAARLGLLALLVLFLFGLAFVMPGDPDELIYAQRPGLDASEVARLKALRGADRGVGAHFYCWLFGNRSERCGWWPSPSGVVHGDLGISRAHGRPVADLLRERFWATLSLVLPALLLALLGSVGLGAWAGAHPGRFGDRSARWLSVLAVTTPSHWLSLLLIWLFALKLGWLPAGGRDDILSPNLLSRLVHLFLPVMVLSLYQFGRWFRLVRGSVEEALSADYVLAARARGLSERAILWRHVLPAALIPLYTVVVSALPGLFSGVLVVEQIFVYPGMGLLVFESIREQDHLVAVATFSFHAATTFLATSILEAGYRWIDPRWGAA